jgi:NIPSNAP
MTTRTALSIAAAFVVGALISHLPAQDRHVYELRTYHTLPGRLDALIARFRDHTTKLFEKHGMRNVGYWVPADAPASQNTLIYIVEHDSREAAKKSWDDFQNDPEWKKVRDASEADGKIVEKIDDVYMTPTDFSKLK